MGLGLMVAELTRDEEKLTEKKMREEYDRFNREYDKLLQEEQNEYRKLMMEERIDTNNILNAEKQFTSMIQKLSRELNKNIHMLQTHKPVVNLNLTININGCENPDETAEAVKNKLDPILDFLR